MQPKAQMSVRLSTGCPRACSGLMYAAVPMMPVVRCGERGLVDEQCWRPRSSALARPKSRTFIIPSARHAMLAGFKSRCTMPCSCAASSALAILAGHQDCFGDRQ